MDFILGNIPILEDSISELGVSLGILTLEHATETQIYSDNAIQDDCIPFLIMPTDIEDAADGKFDPSIGFKIPGSRLDVDYKGRLRFDDMVFDDPADGT